MNALIAPPETRADVAAAERLLALARDDEPVVLTVGWVRRLAALALRGAPPPPVAPLGLQRPLVCFDLETTGTEVTADRIFQFACVRLEPDGTAREFSQRFNPGRPIPPRVTEFTGVGDADVAGCPRFAELAPVVREWLDGADLAGFNVQNFDLPLLDAEFRRAGLQVALAGVPVLDACLLFKQLDPRNLLAAVRKYVGDAAADEFAGHAHEALADVRATLAVVEGQRRWHPELAALDLPALAERSTAEKLDDAPVRRVDLAGLLVRGADGVVRYTHRRVRGVPVADDPGYARWLLRGDFPADTKDHLRAVLGWPAEPEVLPGA